VLEALTPALTKGNTGGFQMATHKTTIHPFPAQGRALTPAVLLNHIEIAREASAIALECRQAILTSFLPKDELIGRLRSSIVVAKGRKAGGQ
jgi:hypothetical protein